MAAYQVLLLNTAVPQIQAAQAGDTYVCPRDIQITANLDVTGNTILGDASTDTVRVNGYMGVGGAGTSNAAVYLASIALTGTSQYGFYSTPRATSAATAQAVGFAALVRTEDAAFTLTNAYGVSVENASKGASSTITNQHGVRIADQTQGTNNYGITSLVSSGTDKWNIYASGTAANYFAGVTTFATAASLTNVAGSITPQVQIRGSTANTGSFLITRNSNDTNGPSFWLGKDRGGGAAVNNDILGLIRLAGNDGTSYVEAARIVAEVDGTPGTNDMPGRLVFSTTADGASSPTERLRIDSSGNVGVGTSSPQTQLELSSNNGAGTALNILRFNDADTTSSPDQPTGKIEFYVNDTTAGGTGVASYIMGHAVNTAGGGYLTFATSPNGATGAIECLRIGSNGNVGIGTISPDYKLQLSGTTGQTFSIERVASSIGSSTALGTIAATGEIPTLTADGASIQFLGAGTWSATSSPGRIVFNTTPAATTTPVERFQLAAGEAVFNEPGNDYDFRVESDTNTHALFVQGSDGNVGIGTSAPAKLLDLAANNTGITTGDPLNTLRFTDTDTTSAVGQPMGRIEWFSADTDTAGVKAYIQTQSTDGSPDADMVFATNHVSGGGTTEKMRIQYDGNIISTAPTTPPTLSTNGTMVFNLTSDTNLRISVRGSDGVTRTANITLA